MCERESERVRARVRERERESFSFGAYVHALGCYLMVNVQCGSSLRDPQHGGLNEFFYTGRTRHFFLQVYCGIRVAHGQVILRACGLVNCRLTVCLYRFSPCRQTSWKTCANSHVDVFHKQISQETKDKTLSLMRVIPKKITPDFNKIEVK